jgi:acylphosphatase
VSAARFLVGGKVQGVWFRAATRERAHALGLRGHARNLADGRVEVLAVGGADGLDALEAWLWQGPPLAKVSEVRREAVEPEPDVWGFETG